MGPVAWCLLGAVGEQGIGLELQNSSSWAGCVLRTPALALQAGTWLCCHPSRAASRDRELGQNWSAGLHPQQEPAVLPEGRGTQTALRSHSCWSCDSCWSRDSCWSCAEGMERAQSLCRRTRCRERRCEQESLTELPVPRNAWLCLACSPPVLGTWPGGFPSCAVGSRLRVPRGPQLLRWLLWLEIEAGAVPGLH